MGDRKRRRVRFFADHPVCCFCAGEAAAVEEDHQPGRVFFREHIWPEGFVFPACVNCNRVSRDAENIASIIIANDQSDRGISAYRARVASVRANFPDLIPSVRVTANEKRRTLARMGLTPPPGSTYADTPIAKLKQEHWQPQLELVGRKLMLAFHYQAFGRPLPRTGVIWLTARTNADDFSAEWFRTFSDAAAQNMLVPTRSAQPLVDQFSMQWTVETELGLGLWLATLQKMVVFAGVTAERSEHIAALNAGSRFAPFSWPAIRT